MPQKKVLFKRLPHLYKREDSSRGTRSPIPLCPINPMFHRTYPYRNELVKKNLLKSPILFPEQDR